jgi:hypothetical protein
MPRWQHGSCWASAAAPWPLRSVRLPGDGRPRPPPAGGAHQLAQQMSHLAADRHSQGAVWGGPGVDTHEGRSWWGGSRGVRYTSRFALAGGRNRAATPCASAQLQHPRQVGPPSRLPIRPKRAAVSRLLAQSLKRDLARLGNREIAAVLERGAGLSWFDPKHARFPAPDRSRRVRGCSCSCGSRPPRRLGPRAGSGAIGFAVLPLVF